MSWQRNYVTLNTGERIRYTLLQRPDDSTNFVRFRSMHRSGRQERSTGCDRKVDAFEAAHQIILEDYGQGAPAAERMGWDDAARAVPTILSVQFLKMVGFSGLARR